MRMDSSLILEVEEGESVSRDYGSCISDDDLPSQSTKGRYDLIAKELGTQYKNNVASESETVELPIIKSEPVGEEHSYECPMWRCDAPQPKSEKETFVNGFPSDEEHVATPQLDRTPSSSHGDATDTFADLNVDNPVYVGSGVYAGNIIVSQDRNSQYKCTACREMFHYTVQLKKQLLILKRKPHECLAQKPAGCRPPLTILSLATENQSREATSRKKNLGLSNVTETKESTPSQRDSFSARDHGGSFLVASFPEENIHTCTLCGRLYASSRSLKTHTRLVHSAHKSCVCDICGKTLVNSSKLYIHRKTHSDDTPYQCASCGKTFRAANHLKRHSMLHTGERPYICDFCGKRCIQLSNLKSHIRTHTGELPHMCPTCGRCFKDVGTLKGHVLRTHART